MSIIETIRAELCDLQDPGYRDFQIKLIQTADPDAFLGIRTPALRALAKELSKRPDIQVFLNQLPHRYFDENQLHAFIISGIRDYDRCIEEVSRFLPYVDNWATCDQLSPKVFSRHRSELIESIRTWIGSEHTYTIRFGIGMLMRHFLDEEFEPVYPEAVVRISSEEYYVNMMRAWYFATALAKQYDSVLPLIESRRLDSWTHNKAIQKAVESYRIDPAQKEYLKSLKVKKM